MLVYLNVPKPDRSRILLAPSQVLQPQLDFYHFSKIYTVSLSQNRHSTIHHPTIHHATA